MPLEMCSPAFKLLTRLYSGKTVFTNSEADFIYVLTFHVCLKMDYHW